MYLASFLKDFATLGAFFCAGYVWLVAL